MARPAGTDAGSASDRIAGARSLRDLGAREGMAGDAPRLDRPPARAPGPDAARFLSDPAAARLDAANARITSWEGMVGGIAGDAARTDVLDRIATTLAEGRAPAPDDVAALRATGRSGAHHIVSTLAAGGTAALPPAMSPTLCERLSANAGVYAQAGRDDLATLSGALGAAAG